MEGEIKVPRRSEWRRLSRHRMRPGRRACRWLLRYPFSELRAESVKIAFPEFGTKKRPPLNRDGLRRAEYPASSHRGRTGQSYRETSAGKAAVRGLRTDLSSVLQVGHYPNSDRDQRAAGSRLPRAVCKPEPPFMLPRFPRRRCATRHTLGIQRHTGYKGHEIATLERAT